GLGYPGPAVPVADVGPEEPAAGGHHVGLTVRAPVDGQDVGPRPGQELGGGQPDPGTGPRDDDGLLLEGDGHPRTVPFEVRHLQDGNPTALQRAYRRGWSSR